MIAFGVALALLGICFIVLTIIANIQDWVVGGLLGFFAGLFLAASITILGVRPVDNKPTAMDVYRGKTALQYTVVDSVKVDSVVVWKIKEE